MCELLKIGKSFLRDTVDNTCANIFFKTHCGQNGEYALVECRDGNGGGGKAKGWGLRPRLAWFCLIPSLPHPAPPRMMRKTFSPHLRPLGPREAPPHPVKLYCLLIYPTTSTIFLMKPISLIKIFLKLQLNLSHKIKSIFRKKLNNISKNLTR